MRGSDECWLGCWSVGDAHKQKHTHPSNIHYEHWGIVPQSNIRFPKSNPIFHPSVYSGGKRKCQAGQAEDHLYVFYCFSVTIFNDSVTFNLQSHPRVSLSSVCCWVHSNKEAKSIMNVTSNKQFTFPWNCERNALVRNSNQLWLSEKHHDPLQ